MMVALSPGDDERHADPAGGSDFGACPEFALWKARCDSGDDSSDAGFLAHAESCPACMASLAAFDAGPTGLAACFPRSAEAEPGLRKCLESLASQGPPSDQPRPPPAIEGLSDLEEIGRGGMGIVYRAIDDRTGRTVAVKLLTFGLSLSPTGRARSAREGRLLARVDHPNVVRIHSVSELEGVPVIVMDWIDGTPLDAWRPEGTVDPRVAAGIVRDLARAVATVHAAGIVHRDIKPSNVLMGTDTSGIGATPILIDFGVARPDDDTASAVTRSSATVGTPAFMAPEQTGLVPTLGPVGPATDIHALGSLLYWLLAGRAPYAAPTTLASLHRAAAAEVAPLRSLVPDLPADLGTIVATCLEQRPERRYRSAKALADDLDRFVAGAPIVARGAGLVERTGKWAKRHPTSTAILLLGAMFLVALTGGGLYHLFQLQRARKEIDLHRDQANKTDRVVRESFDQLVTATAERLVATGSPPTDADRGQLREMMERYRSWPLGADRAAGFRSRAEGLEYLGRALARSLPFCDEAIRATRAARDVLDQGDLTTSDDEVARLRLARSESGLLAMAGRTDEASATLREAIARVRGREDRSAALGMALALALSRLGTIEAKAGRPEVARPLATEAVELVEGALAAAPDDAGLRADAVSVLYDAATGSAGGGEEERLALFERVSRIARPGLDAGGENIFPLGHGLLVAERWLADRALARDRPAAALDHLRRIDEAARILFAKLPLSNVFNDQIVSAAILASRCHAELGHPEGAEGTLATALPLAERGVAELPTNPARARLLVEVLEGQAGVFLATGRSAEAMAAWQRLLDVALPWTQRDLPDGFFLEKVEAARAGIEALRAGQTDDDAA